jgi:hypothetical protein
MEVVCDAFERMMFTWNVAISLPDALPKKLAYTFTVNTLNEKTTIMSSGRMVFDYCDGHAPECPFKEYCPCLQIWEEFKNKDDDPDDDIDFLTMTMFVHFKFWILPTIKKRKTSLSYAFFINEVILKYLCITLLHTFFQFVHHVAAANKHRHTLVQLGRLNVQDIFFSISCQTACSCYNKCHWVTLIH